MSASNVIIAIVGIMVFLVCRCTFEWLRIRSKSRVESSSVEKWRQRLGNDLQFKGSPLTLCDTAVVALTKGKGRSVDQHSLTQSLSSSIQGNIIYVLEYPNMCLLVGLLGTVVYLFLGFQSGQTGGIGETQALDAARVLPTLQKAFICTGVGICGSFFCGLSVAAVKKNLQQLENLLCDFVHLELAPRALSIESEDSVRLLKEAVEQCSLAIASVPNQLNLTVVRFEEALKSATTDLESSSKSLGAVARKVVPVLGTASEELANGAKTLAEASDRLSQTGLNLEQSQRELVEAQEAVQSSIDRQLASIRDHSAQQTRSLEQIVEVIRSNAEGSLERFEKLIEALQSNDRERTDGLNAIQSSIADVQGDLQRTLDRCAVYIEELQRHEESYRGSLQNLTDQVNNRLSDSVDRFQRSIDRLDEFLRSMASKGGFASGMDSSIGNAGPVQLDVGELLQRLSPIMADVRVANAETHRLLKEIGNQVYAMRESSNALQQAPVSWGPTPPAPPTDLARTTAPIDGGPTDQTPRARQSWWSYIGNWLKRRR